MADPSLDSPRSGRLAVFDVNETLIDFAPVRDAVNRVVGDPQAFELWFARVVQMSAVLGATGRYEPFESLFRPALQAVIDSTGGSFDESDWSAVADARRLLRCHPDVHDGLSALSDADGWTAVALTNSSQAPVEAQLAEAGIAELFAAVFSVEQVGVFKPFPPPYRHVLDTMGVDPADAVMVACHDWDLAGAAAVGMETVFVARPGRSRAATFGEPTHSVADLRACADALLAR